MKHEDIRADQKLVWERRYRSGIGRNEWSVEHVPVTVLKVAQHIVVVKCRDGVRHVRAEKLRIRER
jgi:hypothetical protein